MSLPALQWRRPPLSAFALAQTIFLAGCCDVSSIRSESLPNGMVGQPYSFTLEHDCGDKRTWWAVRWTATGNLPPGITLSPKGVFSGTPTAPGQFNFSVELASGQYQFGVDERAFSLTVLPAN
jgi:hypothetical protein